MSRAADSVTQATSTGGQLLVEEMGVDTGRRGDKPSVLLSRTTPNQNARNALRSLVEHDMLAEFWTTLALNPKSGWKWLIPSRLQTQLVRRSISEAPPAQVRSVFWREAVRLGARGTLLEDLLCSRERPFSVPGMGLHFDRRVARRVRELRPSIVYSYDGAALQTFREAKKFGIINILEQTSSYWHWERKLFAEESERNPEFAGLLSINVDSVAHLERKEEELQLADCIFVPSQHVRETLKGVVADERIRVISYGAPPIRSQKKVSLDPDRPLKVLFVGSLIQRKGIGYLLQAVEMLGKQVELTIVGRRFRPNPIVDAACHHWPWFETLAHSRVLDLMKDSDVLVLPSLAEGCALVVLEALACGLPVIVTPNTGSLAFVRDGREGFVVSICQAAPIAERLEVLHRDREMLAEMSRQARVTAAENSWANYRSNLAHAIRSLE